MVSPFSPPAKAEAKRRGNYDPDPVQQDIVQIKAPAKDRLQKLDAQAQPQPRQRRPPPIRPRPEERIEEAEGQEQQQVEEVLRPKVQPQRQVKAAPEPVDGMPLSRW